MTQRPGFWNSPLSARDVTRGARGFADLCVDGEAIYWLESRPDEAGRTAVMRHLDSVTEEISPPDFSARSRINEYGGGALAVRDGVVVASSAADQHLYRIVDGRAELLTGDEGCRYGALSLAPGGDWLVAVREEHRDGRVENTLVGMAVDGGAETCLHQGRDFYAMPAVSPDGLSLAWLAWDHPAMPWDAAELWVAGRDLRGALTEPQQIDGGAGHSVADLLWQPDGRLLYTSERGDRWQPLLWDGQALPAQDGECGLPLWIMGRHSLARLADGRRYSLIWRNGQAGLAALDGGHVATPSLAHFESLAGCGQDLVALAGGPRQAHGLLRIRPGGEATLLRDAGLLLAPELASEPEPILFATGDGHEVQAWYYPPHNPDCSSDELPPLLVMAHGGPTAAAIPELRPKTAFWTSRGFAVVDVNYRGSTGFGRAYREALYGQWGAHDVADCIAAAEYLVAAGRVDPARLFIRGSSAGGLTVLLALCESSTFAAGASYYGVADPVALVSDTHKFEARYMDQLMGPYPASEAIYRDRSPLRRLAQLITPLIVFQGEDDKVVPPAQSEALVDALAERGIPHEYHLYPGEAHGFRQADTVVHSLEAELAFYRRVMGTN